VQETPLPKNPVLDDPKNEYPSFSYLEETMNELPSMLDSDEKEQEENIDIGNILSEKEEKEEKTAEKIIPADV